MFIVVNTVHSLKIFQNFEHIFLDLSDLKVFAKYSGFTLMCLPLQFSMSFLLYLFDVLIIIGHNGLNEEGPICSYA